MNQTTGSGELSMRPSLGQPVAQIDFRDMRFGGMYIRYSNHIRFFNVQFPYLFIRSSDSIELHGGQVGPNNGIQPTIGALSGAPASTNILIDGTLFTTIHRASPSDHTSCLFLQETHGMIVRNSHFHSCEVFDVYADPILGGTVYDIHFINNQWDITEPTGFYAFDAGPYAGSYEFIGNNFHQGMAYSSNVTITGCGNTVVSGVAFPTALRNAC